MRDVENVGSEFDCGRDGWDGVVCLWMGLRRGEVVWCDVVWCGERQRR